MLGLHRCGSIEKFFVYFNSSGHYSDYIDDGYKSQSPTIVNHVTHYTSIYLSFSIILKMSITYDVFRGSAEGKIIADKTTATLDLNGVFIETTHSGLCGTDEHYLKADMVLGHEGVGIVKAIGPKVSSVKVGDRVGFGYTHKVCTECDNCVSGMIPSSHATHSSTLTNILLGWDQYCRNQKQYGFHDQSNGTFSYGAIWDATCVYPIPEGYDSVHAAPLMCAGATVWTVLTEYNVRSTDRVAVMGVGGLGHLAIKIASEMGCHVVVLSSSEAKRQEAMDYGASEYHVFRSGGQPPVDFKPVDHLLLCGSGSVDYLS